MNKSNLGRISIDFNELVENPDKYAALFAGIKFLAHKVAISPFTRRIEYTGYSKQFDLVANDTLSPSYEFMPDGSVKKKTISFIKKASTSE